MSQNRAAVHFVDVDLHFAATRRHIREQIEASEAGIEVNEIVYELLS